MNNNINRLFGRNISDKLIDYFVTSFPIWYTNNIVSDRYLFNSPNNTKYFTIKTTNDNLKALNLIENNISIEDMANTFSYQRAQTVNGITYTTLAAPSITSVTTGLPDTVSKTFSLTGQWGAVTNSSGYNVILTFPNGQLIDQSVGPLVYQANFTGLSQVGMFVYSVNALGNNANNENTNVFFDSQYSSTGIFVLYEDMLPFSFNFVRNIRIL